MDDDYQRAKESGDYDFARRIAIHWNWKVGALFTSDRADIVWGAGGQEECDPKSYSIGYRKRYGGARWKNAGFRVRYARGPGERDQIILESFRKRTWRLYLPGVEAREMYEPNSKLLHRWAGKRGPKNDEEFIRLCVECLTPVALQVEAV